MSVLRAWLEAVFAPFNELLGALPIAAGRFAVLLLLVVPVLVVARLPRRSILQGAPDERGWRDLRVWAALATLPYILIYLFAS